MHVYRCINFYTIFLSLIQLSCQFTNAGMTRYFFLHLLVPKTVFDVIDPSNHMKKSKLIYIGKGAKQVSVKNKQKPVTQIPKHLHA